MSKKLWKQRVLELSLTTNLSWREIAKKVKRPKSTVSDYLRKFKNNLNLIDEEIDSIESPNILLFDIETSLIEAYVWGLFKQNVSLDQIKKDWYVICWSGKWLGKSDIFNSSVHSYPLPDTGEYRDNERLVVEALWHKLDKADIVVAYNGKSFDKKKMNWKFFEYGLPEPSPYKIVDPYLVVKGNFKPTSGKMDFIVKYVESLDDGKHKTGIKLWVDCMDNDVESLDYMLAYCDQDIEVLEHVYKAVRHWDKNAPQMAMFYNDDKPRCSSCGGHHLELVEGKHDHTTLSKFELYRCHDCSKLMRGRKTLLDKTKRDSLLMNVR